MVQTENQTVVPANDEAISLGRLNDFTGFWLRRSINVMATDFGEAMQGTGMRPTLVSIMAVIDANPGLNQGQLGRALSIQRANMVSLVGGLMDRGLVERRDVPGDKRAFALHLTPDGEAMLAECFRRVEAHEEKMLAEISSGEKARLIELLQRICAEG
ncbi:MarR family winged helix-turn-helix transcriptional regulator [Parasphingopyxis marina]|uniref:MarR family transcriptional regulator n=1 Tax=Parasphingopyxis marina TaxID=2761622 RepID=A0A842I141_9SPHN|nr:MarR family transcriptional regulator [Parasphingopyxis marina]MBC2778587.1 MarR family transcriptional regulator [Parasphingopyxis marina]